MEKLIEKAAVLIEALPYIQQFRNAVVVVKFGGSAMEDPKCTHSVLRDIVFMECAGMKPVIVHGGGKAISAQLKSEGVETRFISGLRYTCDRTIDVVDRVLHDDVNAGLVAGMEKHGGRARPVSGKSVLRAEKIVGQSGDDGKPVDLGFVGRVINVDTESIQWTLNRGEVPVITPVARDMGGQAYNVNADMAACRIAAELKAQKLVFLSDVPGILRNPQDEASLISTIRCVDVDGLVSSGVISGGMVPKVRSAVEALGEGVGKVHMIDGRVLHALLLEIFTVEGVGTQIVH